MRDFTEVLSNAQAVTAAAYSTLALDKGLAALDYGSAGHVPYAVSIVTTAFTDGGGNTSTTVDVFDDVVGATTGTFGGSSPVKCFNVGSFVENAAVGARLQAPFPPGVTAQRYLGFKYTPVGANLTAGAITSGFTNDPETWFAYAKAYTVQS